MISVPIVNFIRNLFFLITISRSIKGLLKPNTFPEEYFRKGGMFIRNKDKNGVPISKIIIKH